MDNDKPKKITELEKNKPPVIKFFLKDGKEVKSLEGVIVPITDRTEAAYRILFEEN